MQEENYTAADAAGQEIPVTEAASSESDSSPAPESSKSEPWNLYTEENVISTGQAGKELGIVADMVRYYIKRFPMLFPDVIKEHSKNPNREGRMKLSSKDVDTLREILSLKQKNHSESQIVRLIQSKEGQLLNTDLSDTEKMQQLLESETGQETIAYVAHQALKMILPDFSKLMTQAINERVDSKFNGFIEEFREAQDRENEIRRISEQQEALSREQADLKDLISKKDEEIAQLKEELELKNSTLMSTQEELAQKSKKKWFFF